MAAEEEVLLEEIDEGTTAAEEVVDEVLEYRTVGEYIEAAITEIESQGENEIRLYIDVPYGKDYWTYEKPYEWDTSNSFVKLAENLGYSRSNFHEMIGEDVLIQSTGDGKHWSLKSTPPRDYERKIQRRKKIFATLQDRRVHLTLGVVIPLLILTTLLLL